MFLRLAGPLALSLIAGTAAFAQPAASAGALMKPGLWETVQQIGGANAAGRRTVTSRTCYADDDVKAVSRVLPRQHEAPLKCENRDIKVDKDGAVAWRIVCAGPGAASNGSGSIRFAGESFSAHASLTSKATGKVEQTISGQWLGDCQ